MCSFHKRDYPLDRFGMLTETRVTFLQRVRLSLRNFYNKLETNYLAIIVGSKTDVGRGGGRGTMRVTRQRLIT